jgi:colanic acid biosynthesis glycosyl transferase WcaI
VFDVQDMWPDTLGATGMVRHGGMIAGVQWWLRLVYRRAARITVLSPGFRALLTTRGVPADLIMVIPNWSIESASIIAGPTRRDASDRFDVVYAGNLGLGQGIEVVLSAAEALRERAPHIRFLIAGDGIDAAQFRADAAARNLDNISFLGRLPPSDMPTLFGGADALLVHLRDEPIFAVTIPSKTQAYLQAGKPILMGVRGDAANLIREAGAGIAFEPGNGDALAAAVLELVSLSDGERAAMGASGADYYQRHLSLKVGAAAFIRVFEQVLAESRA